MRFVCLSTCLLVALSAASRANEPLHSRIDQLVDATNLGAAADTATDGEYLRRLYLDLAGMVPPSDVAREFLNDDSPNKRAAILDRLLNSVEYNRHMSSSLDVMLNERRAEKHVKTAEWQKYLLDSVTENKPWDQLVREILAADGTDDKIRPAAAFYLFREGEPNNITRDIGRILFGMDLQCCQCHDHPLIDTYYQSDYFGIYAFVNRGFLFTDKDKKVFYAEKAEGDTTFTSVFTKESGATRPRLPGDYAIVEPPFTKGDEYKVAPADKVRPVPNYSRREQLAALTTSGANDAFNRNIANRLWAHMMGRGLVTPVDLHHVDNSPTHPELLELLADEFAAMKYDLKAFLRELALSRTYQRSLHQPGDLVARGEAAAQRVGSLQTEIDKLSTTIEQADAALSEARAKIAEIEKGLTPLTEEHTKANKAVADAQKAADAAAKKLSDAKKQLESKQAVAAPLNEASKSLSGAAGNLKGDKDVADAATKLAAKAKKLNDAVAAAQKAVNDLTPPAKETADKLATAKQASGEVGKKIAAVNQQIDAARPAVVQAMTSREQQVVARLELYGRLAEAKVVAEIASLTGAANATREKLTATETQLVASRQQLEQATKAMPQLETQVASARTANSAAAKAVDEMKPVLAAKQEVAKLVSASAATAELSVQKLPDDAELKQAAETLAKRSGQLNGQLSEVQQQMDERSKTAAAMADRLAKAEQAVTAAKAKMETLTKQIPQLEAEMPKLKDKLSGDELAIRQAENDLADRWSERFVSTSVAPLTPEQMAWSVMQVTGVVHQQQRAAKAEVDKKFPIDEKKPDDPARLAERVKATEQFVFDKLKGNVAQFVKLFGHAAGQPQTDFFATVDQALYFANGGTLQSWLNPSGGNLTDRTNKLEDPHAVAEELYISILTRKPSDDEANDVAEYLTTRKEDKVNALKEISWALITSAEFRFSH